MTPDAHKTRDNARLALRCQRGSRDAWEELVRTWERPLYYYLRRLCAPGEDALGLLQETWIQVFSSLGSLSDPASLPHWLYVLARRTWASGRASSQRELPSADPDTPSSVERTTFDPADEEGVDAEALHHALDRLPHADRELLTLVYLNDLRLAEVATVLEIPEGTVKSRLSTARTRLAEQLKPRRSSHGT